MLVYHMTTFDRAVNYILKDRRMKLGLFNELNDPFELACYNHGDKTQRALFRKIKNDFTDRYGVICFSPHWKSPLMWAHYAESHTGVCLGFEVRGEQLDEVAYEAKRLVLDVEKALPPKDLRRFLTTKFKKWAYEEELRLIVPLAGKTHEDGRYFVEFSEDLVLTELVLGVRCEHDAEELRPLLREVGNPVTVFKARAAFRSFEMIASTQTTPPVTIAPKKTRRTT